MSGAGGARQSNSCSGFSDDEFAQLQSIAEKYIDASGLLMKLIELAGRASNAVVTSLPENWQSKLGELATEALKVAYNVAVLSRPNETSAWVETVLSYGKSENFHRFVAAVSGAVGGAFGIKSTVLELPITTTLILRSIQEIASSYGEDPCDPTTRQQCLVVLALAGPMQDDDDLEVGFFATRLALGQVAFAEVIKSVAARYTVVVSEKLLAQAAPIVGAGTGAVVNFTFISYFQEIAHVHFRLRKFEKLHDPDQVKSCFNWIVMELRQRERRSVDAAGGMG